MKRIISIWILLLCAGISKVQAQNDATLAGMILVYTNKAEKELKNQEKVMLMQTTGHVWTKEEVEGTTDLQREFNNYLNSFRSIVCYAAQIYGFYHEISQLTDNMGDFTKQLSRHSTGALAVALSTRRNQIYREMILNSVEIVNDIRTACLSDNKMTERERMEIVFGIRPKLRSMNRTTDQGSEIHHDGRHLAGNRRGRTPCRGQVRHRESRPKTLAANWKKCKTLKKRIKIWELGIRY